jgi:precorrin-6A/cobalt-precorrin-6A reductase
VPSPTDPRRVLILGGTGEARALAATLVALPLFSVTSSLAGRVANPALPVGEVHIGGFGGATGLARYLSDERVDLLVDATHPFAGSITANAVAAAAAMSVPSLILRRPGWTAEPGDNWHRVPSIADAALRVMKLSSLGSCVFLTTGRRDLSPFTEDPSRRYLIRSVDPPTVTLPDRHTLLLDRGPYTVEGELALMRSHDVAVLVTKDSGGAMTHAKLVAARLLEIPVVMVDRPALPISAPIVVDTVDAAFDWCLTHGATIPTISE